LKNIKIKINHTNFLDLIWTTKKGIAYIKGYKIWNEIQFKYFSINIFFSCKECSKFYILLLGTVYDNW